MRRLVFAAIASVVAPIALVAQDTATALPIVPTPVSVRLDGGRLMLGPDLVVRADAADSATAAFLRAGVREAWSTPTSRATSHPPARTTVTLTRRGSESLPEEGYRLVVAPSGVTIVGRDAGLFYGVQSLLQLIPPMAQGPVALPTGIVEDQPRFAYRGMHLDVGRHFFPVEVVKRYIDLLAAYKLNTFHWHLTEDQGWRIEIKRYPRLTQVGSRRAQTTIGHYLDRKPQWYDGTPYGGFYTQEQIRDVVRYAAARHVTIMPEIEMPGHATAAIAAYPELSCEPEKPYKVAETFGIWTSVFCPTEATFTFLDNVLDEVIALFPSRYIHIGGDETPKDAWKRSAFAQQLIREKNLKDEHGLQSWFIRRIESHLASKGRRLVGWDEILEGGLAPGATVMSWQGEQGGIAAAREGHDVIMASSRNHLYFNDRPTARSSVEALRATESLRDLYDYDPVPRVLTPDEGKHIVGVTGAIWTEYVPTAARLEYTLLPRLLALADVAWSRPDRKDYARFSREQLPRQLARLDAHGYEYRVPVALGAKDTLMRGSRFVIALAPSVEGARVHYTIDGYPASETDRVYTAPLVFDIPPGQQRELQTVVVTPSNRKSRVTRTVLYNREQPENNPFGVVPGLAYRMVKGPITDLTILERSPTVLADTTSTFDLGPLRAKASSFGVVYSGYADLELDGTYRFEIVSAGPSRLFVDGLPVVDDPGGGGASPRTGEVTLLRGLHRLRVLYAEERPAPFAVWVTPPGRARAELRTLGLRTDAVRRGMTGIDGD